MDLRHARTKLGLAVDLLASCEGEIRQRLLMACGCFQDLSDEHFPVELADDFHGIVTRLADAAWVCDSTGARVVNCQLSLEECSNVAASIVLLYEHLIERSIIA